MGLIKTQLVCFGESEDLRLQTWGHKSTTQTEAEQEQQPDRYASHATVGGTEIYIYICCILNQQ